MQSSKWSFLATSAPLGPRKSLKPLSGFSLGKPSAASSARPESKKPWGLLSLGFLASGLASDAASGLPSENPLGSFRLSLGTV